VRATFVKFCFRACLAFAASLLSVGAQRAASDRIIRVPGETEQETLAWLARRKEAQERVAKDVSVFKDFKFSDGLARSGITFRHRVVDEAGKRFRPNHYDHGTAVAAADVDNDGRIDLYFVNQRGGNELWRNLGGGRFENITEGAGVALANSVNVGASFADLNNDGLTDLFVTTVKMGNHLFRNEGGGRFAEVTSASGIKEIAHSSGAVFFDYNRDGLLDLFVCNVGVYTSNEKNPDGSFVALADAFSGFLKPERLEASILYQNLGNFKFRNVNQELGFEHREWTGDATFCDLDQTGYPGLYAVSMSGRNRYYRNSEGRRFTDETLRTFGRTPWGAMGLKFFDYNQDGNFDLFIADMHSDMNTIQLQLSTTNRTEQFEGLKSEAWCSAEWVRNNWPGSSRDFLFGNAFFENQGGRFGEISDRVGAETYWPWGISTGDLNADGFEDVFITAGMGYPLRYGVNTALLNNHGKRFVPSEFLLGIEPRPGNTVLIDYFRIDCDGADRGHPFCQGKGGQLTVRASTSSRSSVILDLDDDGDLDLVVNNMNDVPLLLLNNLSEKRALNFLKVRLRGKLTNRDGLGALVKVSTPQRTLSQFHDGKSGYLAQGSMPLYFGLASDSAVSKVEIVWASGRKQIVEKDIPRNGTLTIVEPD
jgi:enediyne biosynthesis protein E4